MVFMQTHKLIFTAPNIYYTWQQTELIFKQQHNLDVEFDICLTTSVPILTSLCLFYSAWQAKFNRVNIFGALCNCWHPAQNMTVMTIYLSNEDTMNGSLLKMKRNQSLLKHASIFFLSKIYKEQYFTGIMKSKHTIWIAAPTVVWN